MPVPNAKRWAEAAAVAARQHGYLTYADLVDAGFSRGMIDAAVNSHRLVRVGVGIFALAYVPLARESRWSAAVLAGGDAALLSHRSAATLWSIRSGEGPRIDVTVATHNGRSRDGIFFHRTAVAPQDRAVHRGIPVTSPARTLVDLARILDVDQLQWAMREMQYLRRFDLDAVQEVLSRRPSRKLQPLIDDLFVLRNGFEADLLALCDRYGVPRPARPRKVHGVKVDFHWPEQRVIVETDGWWAHSTYNAFQKDRSNTNLLQLQGWLVLRFTFADVTRRPAQTARSILRALGRAGHDMPVRAA